MLREIVGLSFPKFLYSFSSVEHFIPFHLYLFIKALFFYILCESFSISSWFSAYSKHLLSY